MIVRDKYVFMMSSVERYLFDIFGSHQKYLADTSVSVKIPVEF